MKALLLPLAAVAALAGCASYGDPYGYGYGQPGYGSANVQYQTGPVYTYGTYPGNYGSYPAATYPGSQGSYPGSYGTYPYGSAPSYPYGTVQRDTDGDGTPDYQDRRPNNPYRR